jgi:multidrug efflux pump subunit AcrA (membrane-fusion protein)
MARVCLAIDNHPSALAVQIGAVFREGTQTFVFVQNGDTYERRSVALGRADDRFAEVRSGLKAGEIVAITAVDELQTAFASVR